MAAGRTPLPTEQKRLRGNPGKRPLNDREPRPRAEAPTCPTWLVGEARRLWKRIVPELLALRLLTVVDREALAAYCQAWAELVDATKTLQKEGRICREPVILEQLETTADGKSAIVKQVAGEKLRQHPAVKLQRDAFARVKAFIAEFGLSPAQRSRVKAGPEEKTEEDPLLKLLRNGA